MRVPADTLDPEESSAVNGQPRNALEHADGPKRLESALASLREAVRRKKVDPICAAYQKLRTRAGSLGVRDPASLVRKALGPMCEKVIVSAFSHRHCLMCDGGTVSCRPCRAKGALEDDRICPGCNGLGISSCDFCRGTGWADRDTIPPELRSPVLHRQLMHVRSELKPLAAVLAKLKPANIQALTPDRRRILAARLMRDQARLTDLADIDGLADAEESVRFASVAANIEHVLTFLKENARIQRNPNML